MFDCVEAGGSFATCSGTTCSLPASGAEGTNASDLLGCIQNACPTFDPICVAGARATCSVLLQDCLDGTSQHECVPGNDASCIAANCAGTVCADGGVCVPPVETCTPVICGNGIVDGNDACDDGNSDDNDGCKNDCTRDYCAPRLTVPTAELFQLNQCPQPWTGDLTVTPSANGDEFELPFALNGTLTLSGNFSRISFSIFQVLQASTLTSVTVRDNAFDGAQFAMNQFGTIDISIIDVAGMSLDLSGNTLQALRLERTGVSNLDNLNIAALLGITFIDNPALCLGVVENFLPRFPNLVGAAAVVQGNGAGLTCPQACGDRVVTTPAELDEFTRGCFSVNRLEVRGAALDGVQGSLSLTGSDSRRLAIGVLAIGPLDTALTGLTALDVGGLELNGTGGFFYFALNPQPMSVLSLFGVGNAFIPVPFGAQLPYSSVDTLRVESTNLTLAELNKMLPPGLPLTRSVTFIGNPNLCQSDIADVLQRIGGNPVVINSGNSANCP